MNRDLFLASLVVILGAAGAYLMLPHKHGARIPRHVHAVGATLAGLALLVFSMSWTPPGPFTSSLFFLTFKTGAIGGALLMITARNPIHSALWFAAVVLSTTGLFVLAGAQFLAAGTVIVYAGAIIVTFLFVIMLAQMEGRAAYDRAARTPFQATCTCSILFLAVLWCILHVPDPTGSGPSAGTSSPLVRTGLVKALADRKAVGSVEEVLNRSVRPTARLDDAAGRLKPHVAGLGETLYTDHLVTVELAGGLLFAALVGALAIATPKPPIRPGASSAASGAERQTTTV